MSNFLNKFKKDKKSKKEYKDLYETELSNRKLCETRLRELREENVQLQKETGIAELRKKLMAATDEIAFLKEDRARLYVQLEDLRNEKTLETIKEKGSTDNGEQ